MVRLEFTYLAFLQSNPILSYIILLQVTILMQYDQITVIERPKLMVEGTLLNPDWCTQDLGALVKRP